MSGPLAPNRSRPRARPVKVTSLVTQVATLIEEQCTASGLRPGDSLPAEGQLAADFGVSRIVVREAMKVVEARGLVRRQQGKRAVVAEPNALQVEDYATRSALLDKRNVLELTEVRKAMEVHAARLAAERVRADPAGCDGDIDRARALIAQMRECAQDPRPRAELDVAFHHTIAAMSGNAILGQMLGALDRPLHPSREENHRASLRAGAPRDEWVDEHQQVLDAVLSGDVRQAVATMEDHLDLSLREVQSRPDDEADG